MRPMGEPITIIDTSTINEGRVDEVRAAVKELAKFVEANEPRIVAYQIYFDAAHSEMTVMQIHHDSASVEFHMDVAAPLFARMKDLITLRAIHVYGAPSRRAMDLLRGKARLLGDSSLAVYEAQAGLDRFGGDG